jgi:glutathione S-transferase
VVEIDGEVVTESAYIIHRLLQLAPDSADVETVPSNDSIFWAHFAEGSQMNLLQAGAIIGATSSAWKSGKFGGLTEEGQAGVGKYAQWVSESYLKPQNQTNLDQVTAHGISLGLG